LNICFFSIFIEACNLRTLAYLDNPKGGNGAGSEEWGCKSVYAIHPAGFSFKGVHSSTTGAGKFKSLSGLTIAVIFARNRLNATDAMVALLVSTNSSSSLISVIKKLSSKVVYSETDDDGTLEIAEITNLDELGEETKHALQYPTR
jgi:hypothetical protein